MTKTEGIIDSSFRSTMHAKHRWDDPLIPAGLHVGLKDKSTLIAHTEWCTVCNIHATLARKDTISVQDEDVSACNLSGRTSGPGAFRLASPGTEDVTTQKGAFTRNVGACKQQNRGRTCALSSATTDLPDDTGRNAGKQDHSQDDLAWTCRS